MFKKLILAVSSVLLSLSLSLLVVVPAFAAKPANTVLVNNWTVYNRSDVFAKLWDDNKATALENDGVGFAFNNVSTTWFTAYLKAHYNGDLTDKTITANVSVTETDAVFQTRIVGTEDPTNNTVGLVIKSAEGNWGPNDYWWPTNRLSLSAVTNNTLSADTSISNCAAWINVAGLSACNDVAPWTNYDGTIQTVSPADGFVNALKNVKEVGLSFGGSGYARGVALTSGTASFQLNSFTVAP